MLKCADDDLLNLGEADGAAIVLVQHPEHHLAHRLARRRGGEEVLEEQLGDAAGGVVLRMRRGRGQMPGKVVFPHYEPTLMNQSRSRTMSFSTTSGLLVSAIQSSIVMCAFSSLPSLTPPPLR